MDLINNNFKANLVV